MNLSIDTEEKLHAAVYFLLLAIDQRYPKHKTDSVEHELHKRESLSVIQWQSWRLGKIIWLRELAQKPKTRIHREPPPPLEEWSFFEMFFGSDGIPIPEALAALPDDLALMLTSMNLVMEQAMVAALVAHLNQTMPKRPMPSEEFLKVLGPQKKKPTNGTPKPSLKP